MNFVWDNITIGKALGSEVSSQFKGKRIVTDSRKIEKGDIFVALKGENFDGNKFAEESLRKGAVAAIVDDRKLNNEKFIMVEDALKALQKIGKWRRKTSKAKFIAITGSVGKTGTKEMLYACLSKEFKTYKTEGNLNNHIGLPLTLANMPADIEVAVIELGMNHSGELSDLVRICHPHIAAITWVSETHIEFFDSVSDIARAKAEIFEWMTVDGAAVIPADNSEFDILNQTAEDNSINNIHSFGIELNHVELIKNGARAYIEDHVVDIDGKVLDNFILNNVLLVLTVISICELDPNAAVQVLADLEPMKGRGKKIKLKSGATLIDDSYNASPESMRNALIKLGSTKAKRKIAALGDMRELGNKSKAFHEELSDYAESADLIVTCGKDMNYLHKKIKGKLEAKHFDTIEEVHKFLSEELVKDDLILVKGSHGSNMWKVVDMLMAS